jgi:serine/threonine protein kinase
MASLLRGPLERIETLHSRGYIQRDITQKNIFIQSLVPPIVVIGDFGKTCLAAQDTVTTLGPIYTLAPEVNGKPYDNKIDIWCLGLAWLFSISPKSTRGFQRVITEKQHADLMRVLSKYASRGLNHALLADLLEQMLSFNPQKRPSATQALRHPFFNLCSPLPRTEHPLGAHPTESRPFKKLKTIQAASPPDSPKA